jgi:hypothetical protein
MVIAREHIHSASRCACTHYTIQFLSEHYTQHFSIVSYEEGLRMKLTIIKLDFLLLREVKDKCKLVVDSCDQESLTRTLRKMLGEHRVKQDSRGDLTFLSNLLQKVHLSTHLLSH